MPAQGAIPPPLPPSVERAYKNKCVDLAARLAEVSANNDEYRLRKLRLKRGILKLRLERAFLLEQLEKRTSRNVEDSEGSDSGVATPQEKPLRIKRGHRRPSLLDKIRSGTVLSGTELKGLGIGGTDAGTPVDDVDRDRDGDEDGDVEMGDGDGDGDGEVEGEGDGDGDVEGEIEGEGEGEGEAGGTPGEMDGEDES